MEIRPWNAGPPVAHLEKRPNSEDKHIGVEIECLTSFAQPKLEGAFALANLDKLVYVFTDSSIRGHKLSEVSCELKVLTTESTYQRDLANVCEVLNACGGRVNKSCGLHVHLDMRSGEKYAIRSYRRLVRASPLLHAIVAPSRHSYAGCKLNQYDDLLYTLAKCPGESHASAINADAYRKHKTLEIRLHQGSTNATKISNWISLLLSIKAAPAVRVPIDSLSAVRRWYRLSDPQVEYLGERLRRFARDLPVLKPLTKPPTQTGAQAKPALSPIDW